jgi:hypothetical protein
MAAPKTLRPKEEVTLDSLDDDTRVLARDYREDIDTHDDATKDFDAYEAMHMGQTYDSVSQETSNGLTDSKTATIYLERAARVAGQLPEGEVQAFGKKDTGKGLFMDLLRTKWIYPNANAQRSFRTKMFIWQYGSSEYGFMPMHYDLDVKPNGKVVPDCWIWSPRMFIPQTGFTSISDMDYVHALALKSPSFFTDLDKEPESAGWIKENIDDVKEQIKTAIKDTDPQRDTKDKRDKQLQGARQVMIATRYEAGDKGEWISFLPDFGYKVIRRLKNPHKNGRIPFVIKPCIPTFDSFYNIGDFQRSMPMQFANDGLDNYYFQGIKVNLFPRTVINAQGVVRHTLSNEAGSVIETTNNVNDVKVLETSTAGLSTYQSAKGMAQGAIQSIAGTTDTRANAESSLDPGFGKTPEALKMLQARESTRDNQDRELLEEAMTELLDGMMSLIPTMKNKIPLDLFSDEVAEIAKRYPDIEDIFEKAKGKGILTTRESESGKQMRLRLDPQKLQGLDYRFQLEPNSTMKKGKEQQLQSLIEFMGFVGKMPNALQQHQEATGTVPNWQKIFAQFGTLADVPGMDDMFIAAPKAPQPEEKKPQGGIDPAMLAQAAAMPPEQVAAGGMQPPMPPQAPPMQQPPLAAPQPQMVAPMPPPMAQPTLPASYPPQIMLPEAPIPTLALSPTPPPTIINPMTGRPVSPEIAAQIARIQAGRGL